jgi:hypothetical protein
VGDGIRARLLSIDRAERPYRAAAGIPDQANRIVDEVLGQTVNDDRCSTSGKSQRNASSDALRSAGDQRDLSVVHAFRSVHFVPSE